VSDRRERVRLLIDLTRMVAHEEEAPPVGLFETSDKQPAWKPETLERVRRIMEEERAKREAGQPRVVWRVRK
jgi:hypothetical protein